MVAGADGIGAGVGAVAERSGGVQMVVVAAAVASSSMRARFAGRAVSSEESGMVFRRGDYWVLGWFCAGLISFGMGDFSGREGFAGDCALETRGVSIGEAHGDDKDDPLESYTLQSSFLIVLQIHHSIKI